jgi:hypothetical protein
MMAELNRLLWPGLVFVVLVQPLVQGDALLNDVAGSEDGTRRVSFTGIHL